MDKYKELVKLAEKENIIIGGGHLDANGEAALTFCFNNKIDHIQEIKLPIDMPNEEMLRRIKQYKKPPLVITPHFIWIEQRIDEIIKAMDRYREAKKEIPKEWYMELSHLQTEQINKVKDTTCLIIGDSNCNIEDLMKVKETIGSCLLEIQSQRR
jgi:hypothetical protein